MSSRSRKEVLPYRKYLKTLKKDECQFCAIGSNSDQVVEETASFKVIHNIFPYSFWDMQGVADHLMLVPKKHTDTLKDLTPGDALEFVQVISNYESRGYNIYARAPGSNLKSVCHQHTHLIKPDHRRKSFLFYLSKPLIRFLH